MNSTATPLAAAGYPRTWQRYTMGQRLLRFALYLLVVAVIALPAYNWLLTVTSPALVGTYAFVNPVVAVLLGWRLVGEELTGQMLAAGAAVVIGVMLLVWPKRVPRPQPASAPVPAHTEHH